MNTSKNGLEFLKEHEGCILHVYNDPAGYPTVGIGHLIRNGEDFSEGITEEEALELLSHDVAGAEKAVNDYVRVPLEQHQFDALVSFVFNVGVGAFRKSTLLIVLNQGDYGAVPGQLLRWVYAGGKPILRNRRKAEIRLWLGEA